MKIKPEDYNILKSAIHKVYSEQTVAWKDYRATGVKDSQFAWNIAVGPGGCNPFICNTLYKYLNDSHITTALVRIVKELDSL